MSAKVYSMLESEELKELHLSFGGRRILTKLLREVHDGLKGAVYYK